MSLAGVLQDAVGAAFDAVDDVKVTGVIKATTGSTYDPATQTRTGGTVTSDTVELIKYDFKHSQIDGDRIRHGDSQFMAQASELTLDYRAYDEIMENSKTWRIINAEGIPGDPAYIFHVRLSNG